MFTQPVIRVQIKVNIKAPRHWPLWGEFTGDPAQRVSNAENVSIWLRHHVVWLSQSTTHFPVCFICHASSQSVFRKWSLIKLNHLISWLAGHWIFEIAGIRCGNMSRWHERGLYKAGGIGIDSVVIIKFSHVIFFVLWSAIIMQCCKYLKQNEIAVQYHSLASFSTL